MSVLHYARMRARGAADAPPFAPKPLRALIQYTHTAKEAAQARTKTLRGTPVDRDGVIWRQLEDPNDRSAESAAIRDVFERDAPFLEDEHGVRLRIEERDANRCAVRLGGVPASSILILPANTYPLERQLHALRTLRDRPHPEMRPLLRLFEGARHASWPRPVPGTSARQWMVLTDPTRPGTDEQRCFVERALTTPDFAILEGPPGSGKTTAICEIVLQTIRSGGRVLVCASTHVAVDNVLERLGKRTTEEEVELLPVRIGDADKVSGTCHEHLLERRVASCRAELRKALEARSPTEGSGERLFLDALRDERARVVDRLILDAANVVCGTTIGILQHPEIKASRSAHLTARPMYDLLILDEASKTRLSEFLVPALLARRWVVVGDPRQLSPYVDDAELGASIDSVLGARGAFAGRAVADTHRLLERDQRGAAGALVVASDDEAELDAYGYEADGRGVLVADVDDEDAEVGAVPLPHSRLVLGSASDIAQRGPMLPADVTWVRGDDESLEWLRRRALASAHLGDIDPDALERTWGEEIAWRLARSHETGASRRRSATKDRHEEEARSLMPCADTLAIAREVGSSCPESSERVWTEIEAVRRIALPSVLDSLLRGTEYAAPDEDHALARGLPPYTLAERHVLLSWQHRMHPEISRLPREHVYEGKALSDPGDAEVRRAWDCPRWNARVVWLDVPRAVSGSRNDAEARAICDELVAFAAWSAGQGRSWSVAVLAFYRAQEAALRQRLRALARDPRAHRAFVIDGTHVELCTVDAYQGHEADVVFLSLGRSIGLGFLDAPSRMNVAMTRARYQLVVAGRRANFDRAERAPLLHATAADHASIPTIHTLTRGT